MTRSGLVASVTALLLLALLGSEPLHRMTVDADGSARLLLASLTGFPSWYQLVDGTDGRLEVAIAVKFAVVLVAVFVLALPAGRAGSRSAALLATWGAFVVACAAAGAAFHVATGALDVRSADPLVEDVNAGAVFALYSGVVVALAVVLTVRVRRSARAADQMPAADAADAADAAATATQLHGPAGATTAPGPAPGRARVHGPVRVAAWPLPDTAPAELVGTPPSPSWAPPAAQLPLPAVPLPRRGGGRSVRTDPQRATKYLA